MFVGCNITGAVLLSFTQQFFLGCNAAGPKSNPNYIGPKYAAVIMSIANTVANIPGFAQSAVAGAILDSDNTSEAKWGYIFLVQAVVMTFGGVFFIAFGSTD